MRRWPYDYPGRPPSEFTLEYLNHVYKAVMEYVKKLEKDKGVSLHTLEKIIGHSAEAIKKVLPRVHGTPTDGQAEVYEAPGGKTYIVKAHKDGDPIICDHGYDATLIPIDLGAEKATCPDCGRTFYFYECVHCHQKFFLDNPRAGQEFPCPHGCGAYYFFEQGKVYKLAPHEAFCYDFNRDWAWWWKLKCPNCKAEASLEFSSGKWICNKCGSYVEPKHNYRLFRCILPCGHEHIYNIHYLIDNVPIKCWTCDLEANLPPKIRQAWKNLDHTIFDILGKIVVNGEYIIRKHPWIVPATVIGGPLAVGLGLLLSGSGGKDGK